MYIISISPEIGHGSKSIASMRNCLAKMTRHESMDITENKTEREKERERARENGMHVVFSLKKHDYC